MTLSVNSTCLFALQSSRCRVFESIAGLIYLPDLRFAINLRDLVTMYINQSSAKQQVVCLSGIVIRGRIFGTDVPDRQILADRVILV